MIRSFNRRTLAALAAGASLLALGDAALAQGKYKEAPAAKAASVRRWKVRIMGVPQICGLS